MAKHYKWQDDYSASSDRLSILRGFISSAVEVIHEDIMVNNEKLEDVLKSADVVARRIAATNAELQDGWKLHKTWFRCGFLQLAIYGSYVNDWDGSSGIIEQLKFVYKNLGWDFESARYPKATKVFTTEVLDFFKGYDENGEKEYGQFRTILVPTAKYPEGSLYESKHSGIQWELCEIVEDELFIMTAEIEDKRGNKKFKEMKMSDKDLNKMKRVL